MTGLRRKMQEEVRFRILHLLQGNPEMSQRELADSVGVSVGGMHYVLSALIDKGYIKLSNFSAAKDKRRYAYILTPKGIAEKVKMTYLFLHRKNEEYDALKAEIRLLEEELEAGQGGVPRPREAKEI